MKTDNRRVVASNRAAYHNYEVLETLEVGIVLEGKEVKSLRQGKGNLKTAWCDISNGELFLKGMHISPFQEGSISKASVLYTDPTRVRKLLCHKMEILKLKEKKQENGITLIPLEVYFVNQYVKVKLGVCKGKKLYDKRQSDKEKAVKRAIQQNKFE